MIHCREICLIILSVAISSSAQQCDTSDREMTCKCRENERFHFTDGRDANISKLIVSSCSSVELDLSKFTNSAEIRVIVVRNISESAKFKPFLGTKIIERLELSNVRNIPLLAHGTFAKTEKIEVLRIENTAIGNLEANLADIEVRHLVLINVTVERVVDLHFSERGKTLRLKSCNFRNIEKSLNFAYFEDVRISDSIFQMPKTGQISMAGRSISLKNSIFYNASVNIVASDEIRVNGTCADGKSSLRLSAAKIMSLENRLPTEIIYATNNTGDVLFARNTVCLAGNCRCPKSHAQALSYCRHGNKPSLTHYFVLTFWLLAKARF